MQEVLQADAALVQRQGRVLHVGCGSSHIPEGLLPGLSEIRFDIDPQFAPDIVGDMKALGDIGPFEAVYCCHTLEHVYPQEVQIVLKEFYRVLAPGGLALILVPDLEGVPATEKVMYESPAGPVTGLDMFYGLRKRILEMPYMAHHTGFVKDTLYFEMTKAGFQAVQTRRLEFFNLMGAGVRP